MNSSSAKKIESEPESSNLLGKLLGSKDFPVHSKPTLTLVPPTLNLDNHPLGEPFDWESGNEN